MKKLSFILIVSLILSILFTPSCFAAPKSVTSTTAITFPSKTLEAAIRKTIHKPTGNIYKKDLSSITQFEINFTKIGSIEGIQNLENLVYLHLENGEIKDISPLKSLKKLVDLDLWDNNIFDISALSGLTKLQELVLNDNCFTDLTPLKGMINLKHLCIVNSLSGPNISKIEPLSYLTNLMVLSLAWNRVIDVSPLSKLTRLQELYLHHNQIKDVAPLSKIKSLKSLYLSDNPIKNYNVLKPIFNNLYEKDFTLDSPTVTPKPTLTPTPAPTKTPVPSPSPTPIVEPNKVISFPDKNFESTIRRLINKPAGDILRKDVLAITQIYGYSEAKSIEGVQNLENLTYFEIIDGHVTDLTPLKPLKKLRYINIWNNRVTDLNPLSGLTNLEELILNDNYFSDLNPLKGLINLKKLCIVNTRVVGLSDISALSSLTNLEVLSLADNHVSDLSPLSKLTKLRELYLHGNLINNVEPISKLKSLKTLYLKNNPIASYQPLKNMFSQLTDMDFTLNSPVSPITASVVFDTSLPDLLVSNIPDIVRFCAYGDASLRDYTNVNTFTIVLKENSNTWGSIATDVGKGLGKGPQDLSMYKYVILHMKGQKGGEQFMFGFGYGPTDYYYSQGLTTDWQDIVIDISGNRANLKDVYQFGFEVGSQWVNNAVGATIYVNGIKFSNNLPVGAFTTPK